jgi:MFS family permease
VRGHRVAHQACGVTAFRSGGMSFARLMVMSPHRIATALHSESRGPGLMGALGVIAAAFAGSTLITPLYSLYQDTFGFSEIALTLVYAVYVVGNVIALLIFGRLSDQIGRRRVAIPAVALAAAGTLLFLFARNIAWLFMARVLSGLAVGCAAGTATAWVADLLGPAQRVRASVLAASANFAGIAIGPLIAGALIQYARYPLQLPYLVYLVMLAAVAAVAAGTRETVARRPRNEISLQPRIGVPRELRSRFVAPAVTGFATFALVGFYAALVPSLVHDALGQHNRALGAVVVATVFVAATIVIPFTAKLASHTAMRAGLALLIPSAGLLVLSQALGLLGLLLAASVLAGVASALGYRGSLQLVTEIAPDDRRAEVVSTYYIVGFAGNAVPVIGVGLMTRVMGSMVADASFGGVIILFAVVALLARARERPRSV